MKKQLALLALLAVAGCATNYQPQGFTGGYSDFLSAPDVAVITFHGNGYTPAERVVEMAGLRCAEVALAHGYRYFVMIGADLRGRIVTIDVDYWQPDVLRRIAEQGFRALNSNASEAFVSALAAEAAGSPQLMQALCLNACLGANLRQESEREFPLPGDQDFFRRVCARTAMSADYSSTVEKMKDIGSGFVVALERHPYILTNKHVVENANRVKVGIREDLLFDVPNYRLAQMRT